MTHAAVQPGSTLLLYHQGIPTAVEQPLTLDRRGLRLCRPCELFPPGTALEAELAIPGYGRLRLPVQVAPDDPAVLELTLDRFPAALEAALAAAEVAPEAD